MNKKTNEKVIQIAVGVTSISLLFVAGFLYINYASNNTLTSNSGLERTVSGALTLGAYQATSAPDPTPYSSSSPYPSPTSSAYSSPTPDPYLTPSPPSTPTSPSNSTPTPVGTTSPTTTPFSTPQSTVTPDPLVVSTPFPSYSPAVKPASTPSTPSTIPSKSPEPSTTPFASDHPTSTPPSPSNNSPQPNSSPPAIPPGQPKISIARTPNSTDNALPGITFSGNTTPGKDVTLTIHSNDIIVVRVVADNQGFWSYLLTYPLEPGDHTLTVSTPDQKGIASTTVKNFFISPVYAASSLNGKSPIPLDPLSLVPQSYMLLFAVVLLLACTATVSIYRHQLREDANSI
jgi:hypothetical protein